MHARVTTMQADPTKLEIGTKMFEEDVVPAVRDAEGFKGALLLTDPETGSAIGMTLWDSRETLDRGVEKVNQARQNVLDEVGATSATLQIYEVASSTFA